jgi:hypothetical protein
VAKEHVHVSAQKLLAASVGTKMQVAMACMQLGDPQYPISNTAISVNRPKRLEIRNRAALRVSSRSNFARVSSNPFSLVGLDPSKPSPLSSLKLGGLRMPTLYVLAMPLLAIQGHILKMGTLATFARSRIVRSLPLLMVDPVILGYFHPIVVLAAGA